MVVGQIDAARELEGALRLLTSRWTLALPTAIASVCIAAVIFFVIGAVIVSVIAGIVIGHSAGVIAALGAGAGTLAFACVAIAALSMLSHAIVIAAADDAWRGNDVDFRVALARVGSRLPALIVSTVVIFLMYLIPIVLSLVLIGIPLLFVLSYFLLYVRPAIIVGGEDAMTAIATSFRIASKNVAATLTAFAAIIAAFVVARIVDALTVHVPGIGLATAFLIGGATAAFIALVEVRFYQLLSGRWGTAAQAIVP